MLNNYFNYLNIPWRLALKVPLSKGDLGGFRPSPLRSVGWRSTLAANQSGVGVVRDLNPPNPPWKGGLRKESHSRSKIQEINSLEY